MAKNYTFELVLFILFVFMCVLSSANMECKDEYCTNEYFGSSPILSMSSSMFPAYSSNGNNYHACTAANSNYRSIAFDVNNDSMNEVVISRYNQILVYDTLCTLKITINIDSPETLSAGASLTDFNNDGLFEIASLTNNALRIYYPNGSEMFKYNYSQSFLNLSSFGCSENYCFTSQYSDGQKNVEIFRINTSGITFLYNLTDILTGVSHVNTNPDGKPKNINVQKVNGIVKASFCYLAHPNAYVYCDIINQTGGLEKNIIFSDAQFDSILPGEFYNVQSGFVKTGIGGYYYLLSALYKKDSKIYTPSLLYNGNWDLVRRFCLSSDNGCDGTTYVKNHISDISVGDFNKDGNIDYCYFSNDTGDYTTFLCYDNGAVTLRYNFTFNRNSTGMKFPYHFQIADFNTSDSYMSIVTEDGILRIDPDGTDSYPSNPKWYFKSNFSYYAINKTGIVFFDNNIFDVVSVAWTGNPVYFYSDISSSEMITPFISSSVCGDGVCSGSESIFTCADDCLNVTSTVTHAAIGYDACIYGQLKACSEDNNFKEWNCQLYTNGSYYFAAKQYCPFGCFNGECQSPDSPIIINPTPYGSCTAAQVGYTRCYNGSLFTDCNYNGSAYNWYSMHVCVNGCANTTSCNSNTSTTTTSEADMRRDVGNIFNILFFGNSFIKFMAGIGLLIALVITTVKSMHGYGLPVDPFVVTIFTGIYLVLLTIIGLIPLYVMILIVIVIVLIWLIRDVIFPANRMRT